jgi:hypothetical protein
MVQSLGQRIVAAPRQLSTATGISQDNIIFAMVLLSFFIWITSKGELPTYLAFFKPGNVGPPTDPITATPSTGAAATNAATGTPNVSNPGTSGAQNPVGALTNNPATLFGLLPTIRAIPGKIGNSISSGLGFGNIF